MKTGKLVSIVLTLAMLLSVLPMSAMAYGTNGETAEIKVSFDDIENTDNPHSLASASLVTKKDNSATLTIPNSTITGYDTVTVSADRWSETDLLLDYSMSYKGSESINFGAFFDSFHNFGSGTKTLSVQVEDVEVNQSANYSLRYSEGTFCATPGSGQDAAAQNVWKALSDDSRIAVTTKSDDDSKIILPVGSAIYLKSKNTTDPDEDYDYESITVTDAKLTLDNFDDLNSMAAKIASHTAYSCEDDSNDDAYKLILKAGTTIAVKTRVITILKDLTITLNGGEEFFEAIEKPLYDGYSGLNGLYYSFVDVKSQPDSQTAKTIVSGTSAAEAAARIVDAIFAGLKAGTNNTLKFTFATSTDIVSYSDSEGYVTLYTADNANTAVTSADQGDVLVVNSAVSIGNTSNTANRISVAANSVITVESSGTKDGTEQTANTSEITYTPAGETETKTAYVVSTSNSTTSETATVALVAEKFTVDTATVNDGNDETKPTSYVDLTQVITSIAAEATDDDMETIATVDTTWTLKLDDSGDVTTTDVDSAVAGFGVDANKDTTAASVYVDVQPVMTVTAGSALISKYNVPNDQLAAGAKFQYTIGGLTPKKPYHIYHVRDAGDVEDLDVETADSEGKATIELTSFSPIVAVPLTTPGSADAEIVSMNAYIGEFFILNLYVKTAEANPIFHFKRDDYLPYTLQESANKSAFVNDKRATYYVEEITTTNTVWNGLDIENKYHGKMDPDYEGHYYMVSVKLYTAFLNSNVIMSMKDGDGNDMTIKDYYKPFTTYTLGNDSIETTQSHSFVEYLGMMNTYYTKEGDTETAGHYNALYTGLTAAAAAARVVAPPTF